MDIKRDMIQKSITQEDWHQHKSIGKNGENEDVNTDVLRKICAALDCTLSDIVKIVPDDSGKLGRCTKSSKENFQ